MIFTTGAKDERNIVERKKNLISAVRAGKHMTLYLEPASICNLSCTFCDLHSGRLGEMDRKKGIMSLELYQLILDEIADLDFRFETVFFHGNGEPLLNRNIVEMISMAAKRGIANKYAMFTNGTLMKPGIFDRLMASGINEINVSLDSINPSVYKKFKGKDLLADVLENIDYAIEQILRSPAISLVIKGGDGGDVYGLGDENLKQIINKYKAVAADSQHIHIKNVPVVENMDGFIKQRKENHQPCEMIFYFIYIKYDGKVSPCCADLINAINIGKIGSGRSFKDILKGKKLTELRKIHLLGNLDQIPLCKYCGSRGVVDLSDYRSELLSLIEPLREKRDLIMGNRCDSSG